MRVAVIDYGIGNVQSVLNACRRLTATAERVTDGVALMAFAPDRIILPGVGAIGTALQRLRETGLDTALADRVLGGGTPFLGICVGMQMLADACEEFGSHQGLGWIPGRVVRLGAGNPTLRVPHVGWNTVRACHPDDPLFGPLDGRDFYFVHSYAMDCPADFVAATTKYGGPFVSAVRRGAILGVQFHPEKSTAAGADLLARFLEDG
ncbi:hypothetical protein VY88_28765 [Azospirillum thiophilum]|uniref:Imidazole glycerol phosphate synthase subunit HisH n=1 Tax=Azospirillum thiophilum TaxID=528244 RepID=A0AAC8ZWH3_9PROT|nr:imidazole glycerol phosphate synthase subunit HisH [Azospirillum thiophilum]ALG75579.1 hypothetical protein AL072_32090 [Azospirillum thiophilum]KJR62100.1 hypothetical protein VY88_28765 [Azospirillum thiophilum]